MRKIAIAVLGACMLIGLGTTTAVAERLVNSQDIKNGTIRSVDVADGGLGLRDFNDFTKNRINQPGPVGPQGDKGNTGPQGPKGETGATGATGPAGPAGPAGANGTNGTDGEDGVSGYYVKNVTVAVGADDSASADVYCNDGTFALGGGLTAPSDTRGYGSEADLTTNVSGPLYATGPNGDAANGWHVVATNTSDTDLAFLAWVTCAAVN